MLEVIDIDNSSVGLRIDRWIRNNISKIPQSLIEKDLRNGKIKVNKKKIKSSYKLNLLDKIYLYNVNYKILTKPNKQFIPKTSAIKDTEKDVIELKNIESSYDTGVVLGPFDTLGHSESIISLQYQSEKTNSANYTISITTEFNSSEIYGTEWVEVYSVEQEEEISLEILKSFC